MGHKTLPMRINRMFYDQICQRANYLATLGPVSHNIISEYEKEALVQRGTKGLNPFQLQQYVMRMSERLFRTEKRIVENVPQREWQDDEQLYCLQRLLDLKQEAEQLGYEIALHPGDFVLKIGHLEVVGHYETAFVDDVAELLRLYAQRDSLPLRSAVII